MEKFVGELACLNVILAQPEDVFRERRRDVLSSDCDDLFLKAGALHGGAGDAAIREKDSVRIALVFGGLW